MIHEPHSFPEDEPFRQNSLPARPAPEIELRVPSAYLYCNRQRDCYQQILDTAGQSQLESLFPLAAITDFFTGGEFSPPTSLLCLGAGDMYKEQRLLEAFARHDLLDAITIHEFETSVAADLRSRTQARYPGNAVRELTGELEAIEIPRESCGVGPLLITLLGGTFGNLLEPKAFLQKIAPQLRTGDQILLDYLEPWDADPRVSHAGISDLEQQWLRGALHDFCADSGFDAADMLLIKEHSKTDSGIIIQLSAVSPTLPLKIELFRTARMFTEQLVSMASQAGFAVTAGWQANSFEHYKIGLFTRV